MFKGNKGVFIGLIVMILSLIVVLIGMIINVDNERKITINNTKRKEMMKILLCYIMGLKLK